MTAERPTVRAALRSWGPLAALLVVALVSGLALNDLDFGAPGAARDPSDAPDAYMEHFVTVEMDHTGRPKRRVEAEYMAFNADQTVDLSSPHYVLHRAGGGSWHVRSARGRVSADGSEVMLLGGVDIWRNDASGARDLDIRTANLKVLPDSGYGETAEPVTIRLPGATSTGVGMRAWLDETRIELLSRVRTDVDRRRP